MRRNCSANHFINCVFSIRIFKRCMNKNMTMFVKIANKNNIFAVSYTVLSLHFIITNVNADTRIRIWTRMLIFPSIFHKNVVYFIRFCFMLYNKIWNFFTRFCVVSSIHSQNRILKLRIVFNNLTLLCCVKQFKK